MIAFAFSYQRDRPRRFLSKILRQRMTRRPTHSLPTLTNRIQDPRMARWPKRFLLCPSHSSNNAILFILLRNRNRTIITTTIITTLRALRCGRQAEIPVSNRLFFNDQVLWRNFWRDIRRPYHDDVLVFVLSVAVVFVFVKFNLHLCDVFEIELFEERISRWGGLEVTL